MRPVLINGMRLDLAAGLLTRDGEVIPLRPKLWMLLTTLVRHRNQVVPGNVLVDALWPQQQVDPRILRNLVGELRQALGDTGGPNSLIQNLPRRGYLLRLPDPPEAPPTDRAAVLQAIQRRIRTTPPHGPCAIEIVGAAGCGKTTLLRDALRQARAGRAWTVVDCEAAEASGTAEPLGPVLRALAGLAERDDRRVQSALRHAAPGWSRDLSPRTSGAAWPRDPGSARPERTLAGMVREAHALLQHLALQAPVLLVLDDLHWADAWTLDLLVRLLSPGPTAPLLALLARHGDWAGSASQRVDDLMLTLQRSGRLERIHLDRLTCAEVSAYRTQQGASHPRVEHWDDTGCTH